MQSSSLVIVKIYLEGSAQLPALVAQPAEYTCNEINPNNKDAYFLRGMILITIDQKEAGCVDLSKAGELGDADAYEMIRTYCQKD